MKKSIFATIAVTAVAGSTFAGQIGPDVIVGSLPTVARWGTLNNMTAYSVATTSCNIGDTILNWNPRTNVHPVIGQSVSRVAPAGDNGTMIEMLGSSWLKHGFCALQGEVCGSCQSAGMGCPIRLGIGCSDPYNAGLNADQTGLGLPAEVNAHTGFYPTNWTGEDQTGNVIFKRIQVANSKLSGGIAYFVGGQYVQSEDSAFGNQDNNASYRRVNVAGTNLFPTGTTTRMRPVIDAWKDMDSSVNIIDVMVPEPATAGDNDGLVVFAYDVSQNNDGSWHYEYAMNNVSSDNKIRGFAIPGLDLDDVENLEFTDVDYHSGSPISNTDWDTSLSTDGRFEIAGQSFASNANANSLWWGRLYRIGFDSPNAPVRVSAELRTFKTNELLPVGVLAPQSAGICLGDCNGDSSVDFQDIVAMLFEFGNDTVGCDADESGSVGFPDVVAALFVFGPCP